MKSLAHISWLALGLGLAVLSTGCVSSDPRTAHRIEPASDIEVVETSARRPLTAREMNELRGTVARYLDQQGQTDSGDYYLKVYLTPEVEGVTPEWVVVRFTRYSDTRVAVASDYPAYDDSYASSYYSYDLYPYGYYGGFNRISFQYYDDPFYGRRYYYPRHEHRNRDHDHDRDHHRPGDHKPGDRPPDGIANHHQPRPDNPRRRTPDRIAPIAPRPVTNVGSRAADNPAAQGRPLTAGTPHRPVNQPTPQRGPDPTRQWRGRNENSGNAHSAPRTVAPSQRAEARSEPRQYSPPPAAPRVQSEPRSTPSSSDHRDDSRRNLP